MTVEKLTWPGWYSEVLSWHEAIGTAVSKIANLVQRMRPRVEILSNNIFRSTELQVSYMSLKPRDESNHHSTTELIQ